VTPAGRPEAVRRFVRRPLWWALLTLLALGWIFVDDTITSRHSDERFDTGPTAVAEVEDDVAGGGAVVVSFVHPELDAPIRTVAELWSVEPPPEPGTEVPIEIDRDDPTRVALAGDRRRPTAALGFEIGLAAVPLVFFFGRVIGVRRTETLVRARGPSFSMLGALRSSGRVRPHVVLDLYPLDTAAGGTPICSVPLLHTAAAPLGRSYRVEVKGSPRPLGRVVARLGNDTLLWPRGRASWGAAPWSVDPALPRTGSPVTIAVGPMEQLDRPKWTNRWASFPPVLAMTLAGTVALGLLVSVSSVFNRSQAAGADRSPIVVMGEVVDRNPGFAEITVRYRPPDADVDVDVDAVLVVDDDDLHPDGSTVALRVDPDDPANVRLASEPYNMVVPLVWGWLPAFGAGLATGAWLSVVGRNRRAARSGWRRAAGWRLAGTDLIALAHPDAATASCVARLPSGSARNWPVDHGSRDAHVAGSMTPGDAIAVRIGDRAVAAVWVAETPPGGAPVERPGGGAARSAA
jgi:hypothetical protein